MIRCTLDGYDNTEYADNISEAQQIIRELQRSGNLSDYTIIDIETRRPVPVFVRS